MRTYNIIHEEDELLLFSNRSHLKNIKPSIQIIIENELGPTCNCSFLIFFLTISFDGF